MKPMRSDWCRNSYVKNQKFFATKIDMTWDSFFAVKVRTLGRRPNAAVHEKDRSNSCIRFKFRMLTQGDLAFWRFPVKTTNNHNPTGGFATAPLPARLSKKYIPADNA